MQRFQQGEINFMPDGGTALKPSMVYVKIAPRFFSSTLASLLTEL